MDQKACLSRATLARFDSSRWIKTQQVLLTAEPSQEQGSARICFRSESEMEYLARSYIEDVSSEDDSNDSVDDLVDKVQEIFEAEEILRELSPSRLEELKKHLWKSCGVDRSLRLAMKHFDEHGQFIGLEDQYLDYLKSCDLSDERIYDQAIIECVLEMITYDGPSSVQHRRDNINVLACLVQLQKLAPNSQIVPRMLDEALKHLGKYDHDWTSLTPAEKEFLVEHVPELLPMIFLNC